MHLKLRPRVIAGDKLENDYQVIWDGIPNSQEHQSAAPTGRGASCFHTCRSSSGIVDWKATLRNPSGASGWHGPICGPSSRKRLSKRPGIRLRTTTAARGIADWEPTDAGLPRVHP